MVTWIGFIVQIRYEERLQEGEEVSQEIPGGEVFRQREQLKKQP